MDDLVKKLFIDDRQSLKRDVMDLFKKEQNPLQQLFHKAEADATNVSPMYNKPTPYFKTESGEPIKNRHDFEGNILNNAPAITRRINYYPLGDLYRYFSGKPLEENNLTFSKYKPSVSKDKDIDYISINNPEFKKRVLDTAKELFSGTYKQKQLPDNVKTSFAFQMDTSDEDRGKFYKINDNTFSVSFYSDSHERETPGPVPGDGLGRLFISKGKDEKGEYISYYDRFDVDSGKLNKKHISEKLGAVKPFEIYDRIYLND